MRSRGWAAAGLLAAAVAASPARSADAAGERHVVVEAEVPGAGKTPAEGRREALQRAREMAVAEVAGIHVSAQQLRLRAEQGAAPDGAAGTARPAALDAFASVVRTATWGRIVREDVVYRTTLVDGTPVYHARLDADVRVEERAPDPGFSLEVRARPDTHTFRDGETVTLELAASRDCWVTLLNVLADGTVTVLFPASAADDNRVEAGARARFPAPGTGHELRVHLAGGRERDYEQLLAIATLDPLPLAPETIDLGPAAEALVVLNRWLVAIPIDRRTEALWDYEVVR